MIPETSVKIKYYLIIDDVFALATSGRVSETLALDLLRYFPMETEWAPVKTASTSLSFIGFMLTGRPGSRLFKKYMLDQFSPLIDRVGFRDTGSYQEKMVRSVVLEVAVVYNHTTSVRTAKSMYNAWMRKGERIPTNLR